MSIFTGMRGSSGLEADGTLKRRPENWRESILMLYPNGQTPLTALTALMGSEGTTDPIFHWFEKDFPTQTVASTNVYSDALTTALTGSIAQGTQVWVKMAAADVVNFKAGHIVTVRATASGDVDKNFLQILVTAAPTVNGANSYITGKTISAAFTSLTSTLYISATISGTAHPEGDTSPTAISYDPSDYANYTQIFRDSLENTRTASKTRLRTGPHVAQAKKECLELHGIGMERAFFFNGPKYLTAGSNGQPLRITAGLRGLITTNKIDFRAVTGMGSTTFAASAAVAATTYQWLMEQLEVLFRYGSPEKIGFCGSGVLLGLQKMLTLLPSTNVQLSAETWKYGFKVQTLVCPFGTLVLKHHPLFTQDASSRYDMTILDTKHIKYRYVDDTKYLPNRQANDLDGEKSEFLTECGMELHFEKSHMILNGFGQGSAS